MWEWCAKTGKPPAPFKKAELENRRLESREAKPGKPIYYTDIISAIMAEMSAKDISVGRLANMTGILVPDLERIVSGEKEQPYCELVGIMMALNIVCLPLERP